jgi:dTDP-4-dehydrorhamnose reductase
MRILVTGVSGQVGAALAIRLSATATVIAPRHEEFDLAQPDRLAAGLDTLAPVLIINAAAYTTVDRGEDEPALAERVNAEAPAAMAQWAASRDVPMIQFSTDYVFDGSGNRPWREDDPPHPLSVYGSSKLNGERAVRAAHGDNLIVRTSWVYAAQGRNFLRTVAALARDRTELRIVADQIGAPTSAALIADCVAAMLAGGIGQFRQHCRAAKGIVHLAAAGEASWHVFAQAIVAGLRERHVPLKVTSIAAIRTADYPTRARRPLNSRLDLTRLRDIFGISPPHWPDALRPELDRLAAELR